MKCWITLRRRSRVYLELRFPDDLVVVLPGAPENGWDIVSQDIHHLLVGRVVGSLADPRFGN